MPRELRCASVAITLLILAAMSLAGCGANRNAMTTPSPAASTMPPPAATIVQASQPSQGQVESDRPAIPIQPSPSAPHAPTATPMLQPTTTAATQGGTVCLGTFGYGVTCLDENGWQTYNKAGKHLLSDQVQDLVACPDGRLLVVTTLGISLFDGQTWTSYRTKDFTSPAGAACDAAGNIWLTHYKGVSRFDGQAWITTNADQLATGQAASNLVEDVAVSPDGTVWVLTTNSVAHFDGRRWNVFQEGQGFYKKYFFRKIIVDKTGQPWATHSAGVVTFDGKAWSTYDSPEYITSSSDISMDADGRVWIITSQRIATIEDGAWQVIANASDLSDTNIRSLAFDAQGRLWAGTEWGLNILDGGSWVQYHMHTADLADNDIRHILVLAGSPPLPPTVTKENGALTGQAIVKNQPLAKVKVQLCPGFPHMFSSKGTPCSGRAYTKEAVTDAKGYFNLSDVLAGHYALVFELEAGQWMQLKTDYGATRYVAVEAGQTTELGRLNIEPPDD